MSAESEKYRVFNRDAIKYFAMFAMLLNHIANIFMPPGTLLYEIFIDIGYFTAITMCYFLVEGYRYTHSKKRYGIRLAVFAAVSQFPFSFAFRHGMVGLNMIFTLFICFLILVVREKYEKGPFRTFLQTVLVLVTAVSDWQFFAAIFTIMFDAWRGDRKKIWKAYRIAVISFGALNLISGISMYGALKGILCGLGACLGLVASGITIQFLYNGKRAEHGGTVSKWFFYVFYPAHLLALGLIDRLM